MFAYVGASMAIRKEIASSVAGSPPSGMRVLDIVKQKLENLLGK